MELLLTTLFIVAIVFVLYWVLYLAYYFLYKHSIYFRHAQLVEEAYRKYGTF